MAKKYHPDLLHSQLKPNEYQKAQDKFKEINEAYQILSNEELRMRYDQFLGLTEGMDERTILDENSLYAKILRRREQKMRAEEEPRKPFDLDEELRKLEQIKMMRHMEMQSKRNEANRKR